MPGKPFKKSIMNSGHKIKMVACLAGVYFMQNTMVVNGGGGLKRGNGKRGILHQKRDKRP